MSVSVFIHNMSSVLCSKGMKTKNLYSGFGGSIDSKDPSIEYAGIRELLEELFDVQVTNFQVASLIKNLGHAFPSAVYPDHHIIMLPYDNLKNMLYKLRKAGISSRFYPANFPRDESEIIFLRNRIKGEVYGLRKCSIDMIMRKPHLFSREFLSDVAFALKMGYLKP